MCAESVATVGSAYAARQEICEMGRRIYARAFVAANDGNISARLGPDRVLCTPTGVSKGFLKEDMLAICDMDGAQVSGPMKISSEIRMHLEAYKLRGDIAAVVHAHPPTATGFAVAGLDLTECVLPEVVVLLGGIPLAPYGTPGGPDIFTPMRDLVEKYDAVLMANHGAVTLGKSVQEAHFKMETVEHFARIALVARQLGSTNTLSGPHVEELIDLRSRFGITGPSCSRSETGDGTADLVDQITKQVVERLHGSSA
ncbi:MAG TPA: class II aldolase/adducin family protein [Candidatus Latescibacteria bacterium]|jgi:L-fuculose-phosphate aldolase|nr:aldolase [Gemmatimonadaceae bacterium]HJP31813.1 class II aldolase/adducin family protein [Candidatus Latescibacterota bacterium]